MSQNIAAIVATAQSLDTFIASALFSETIALQLHPTVEVIRWSDKSCAREQDIEHCQPFSEDGSLLITAGYVLSLILLLPLGLRNLEENIIVQMISCVGFCLLVFEFVVAFFHKGVDADLAPWVGSDFSSLVGVVLFNYGFIVTVPAWLMEKRRHVPVNGVIWSASIYATVLYAFFAVVGCMAFKSLSFDILTLLGSAEMDGLTRMWFARALMLHVSLFLPALSILCVCVYL